MRPGEQILTAGILELLPRERGVVVICMTGLPATLTRFWVQYACPPAPGLTRRYSKAYFP
jgi:hypothetical protein